MQVPMPHWDGPPPPERVTDYVVGLDLAQAQDPTAPAVVERTYRMWLGTATYACRELKRWPLGTPYPEIVAEVGSLLSRSGASANVIPLASSPLVVDATGVGHAVVDLFARLPGMSERIVRVVVTSGQAASCDTGTDCWQVPRKELVGTLQMLLQTGRLAIAATLPDAKMLVEELQTFKAKVKIAGNNAAEDWRERENDDLVLALGIALWHAERNPPHVWCENDLFAFGGREPIW